MRPLVRSISAWRLWFGQPFGWRYSQKIFKAGLREAYKQYSAEINVGVGVGALVMTGLVFCAHPLVGALAVCAAATICVGFTTSMAAIELDEANVLFWTKLATTDDFMYWLWESDYPEAVRSRELLRNQNVQMDDSATTFVERLSARLLRKLEAAYFDWCEKYGETPAV